MFRQSTYRASVGLCLLSLAIPAEEATYNPPDVESLASYATLVDELNQRRRLQFLFQNPQAIFDGLNIGYVQVASGNLTFQRRDLVSLGSVTVVASRIHDSRMKGNTGFGPRWRLGLAETIVVRNGDVAHTDDHGARHRFKRRSGAMYEPARPSPATQGSTLALIEGTAFLRKADGSLRQFQALDRSGVLALRRRVTPAGNVITLHYDRHRLQSVAEAGNVVLTIHWSGDNIQAIRDRHGRTVMYNYNGRGLLTHVTDLAGQKWSYAYDERGRLVRAGHADGQPYLAVAYDADGRVAKSNGARVYAFRYADQMTLVSEPDFHEHTFLQNEAGTTIGYHSNRGIEWQVGVDAQQRPVQLKRRDASYGLTYAANRVDTITHPDGALRLHYDELGRFLHGDGVTPRGFQPITVSYLQINRVMADSTDGQLSYTVGDRSRLTEITRDGLTYQLAYDVQNQLSAVTHGGQTMSITRNALGRIVAAHYPNRANANYVYDALGNRTNARYASGANMRIEHDGRGNIVRVVDTNRAGEKLTQSYQIDVRNRVETVVFPGPTHLRVNYGVVGRPDRFDLNNTQVHVEYDL